ncbi:MAG: CoB--CoM heterodisulfide reductase iron-sulfur subunit A family protein [Bacteroidales bacterium]|nr:CoB--CoM heterodisulfide reductase iron-sulfur subunit A family protein [Bacteroidales bacterium]
MGSKKNTGIFLCDPLNGQTEHKDIELITSYAEKLTDKNSVFHISCNSVYDHKHIESIIEEQKFEKIIIAGYLPGLYKSLFTKAMVNIGNDPENIVTLSFKEYGIKDQSEFDRAKALLATAIYDKPFTELFNYKYTDINEKTLVIGGGISGIQTSLEIADAGKKVYLLEKTGTIGGHMAMFDKTFPTLDCAACILTPKMVDVGQHPHIDLMSYSEVKEVSGKPGNFKVKILKKARKVDLSTCIGCGSCTEKCPSTTLSEFDSGTTLRKAIYIPFPQAVPNKYLIDKEICTYIKDPYLFTTATFSKLKKENVPEEIVNKLQELKGNSYDSEADFITALDNTIGTDETKKYFELINKNTGKCKVCIKFCPVNDCINLDEKDEEIEITVGNIVVATGFKPFDAERADQFGYGKLDNVLTSLELERLINASGPTEGKITLRTSDKKGNKIFEEKGEVPESVAIIHCIGSRDENYNKYCSKVCCMYSLKLAHLVKEKLPDADVYEYYIDMRAFGKGYEEFYNRINNEGINIIRGKTAKVEQINEKLQLRGENILEDKLIEESVDMVVLAVGLEARDDAGEIAKMLDIPISEEGWFIEANHATDPSGTVSPGISIAGVCNGPKDIPDSVAQASAAAAKVIQSILKGKIKETIKDIKLTDIEEQLKEIDVD